MEISKDPGHTRLPEGQPYLGAQCVSITIDLTSPNYSKEVQVFVSQHMRGHAWARSGPFGAGGSPKRLYKAPTEYTKPQNRYTKSSNIRQSPDILDNKLKYLTRVATTINFTYNTKHPISKTLYLNQRVLVLIKSY